MKYLFLCDKCNLEKIVDIPMGKLKDNPVFCDKCNTEMHQTYNNDNNVLIPDYMKADTDDPAAWAAERLKNSRFSGKDQIYF